MIMIMIMKITLVRHPMIMIMIIKITLVRHPASLRDGET